MRRKLLATVMSLVMVFSLVTPVQVFADAPVADDAWYSSGEANNEWIIYDVGDMLAFKEAVNNGTTFAGKTVKLGADMDMSEVDSFMIGASNTEYFAGTFDGQGHVIRNLTISESVTFAGLFTSLKGATVKNFTLEAPSLTTSQSNAGLVAGSTVAGATSTISGITVTGGTVTSTNQRVGGLLGSAFGTTRISDCTVGDVNVSGTMALGGVVGYSNNGALTVTDCMVNATVSSTATAGTVNAQAGGILGYANLSGKVQIQGCVVSGSITGSRPNIGGIIGHYNAANTLTVTGCTVSADVSGRQYNGGMVGYKEGTSAVTMEDCLFSGSVTATATPSRCGGMLGYFSAGAASTFSYCTVTGEVGAAGNNLGGGIIGQCDATVDMTVGKCVVTGEITGSLTGTFVGNANKGVFALNCNYRANYGTRPEVGNGSASSTVALANDSFDGETVEIGNANRLLAVAYLSRGSAFAGGTLQLAADVDMSGIANFPMIGQYELDGTATGKQFQGSFDGAGHTVSHLRISATGRFVGMFSVVNGNADGSIHDLTLLNPTVTSTVDNANADVGILAGYVSTGTYTFDNVTIANGTLDVPNGSVAGSLIGTSTNALTVTDCSVGGSVSGNSRLGGMIGYVNGGSIGITGCESAVNVTSAGGTNVGGLCGQINNTTSASISNTQVSGRVENTVAANVGGFLGALSAAGTVENSCFSGTVQLTNTASGKVGGFVGNIVSSGVTLRHVEMRGTIQVNSSAVVGGLIGGPNNATTNVTMTVSDSLVSGSITAPNSGYTAALIGETGSGTIGISATFFDTASCNYGTKGVGKIDDGVTLTNAAAGLTTAQLTAGAASFNASELDYTTYWATVGDGAPQLRSFFTGTDADGQFVIDSYRSSLPYSAPTRTGYLFGGWYQDSECTIPLSQDTTTGTAYAKWVDAGVLTIRKQLKYGARSTDDKVTIRVLTTVDSLQYHHINFRVSYNNGTQDKDITKSVINTWSSITGIGEGGSEITYYPTSKDGEDAYYWSASSQHIAGCAFNVNKNLLDKEMTFWAEWVTLDGTTVAGAKRIETPNAAWNLIRWNGSAGTEVDPYVIHTAGDLYDFASLAATNNFSGKYIVLDQPITVNDGDAAAWASSAPGREWTPIGAKGANSKLDFAGTFDGQGHTVSGLYMNTNQRYSGLFAGIASTGAVQNLKLTNSYFTSTNREFGGIAGKADGSTFYNVYTDAILVGSGATNGGLVGMTEGDVTLANCWFGGSLTNTMNVTGHQGTGGLIGYAYSGTVKMVNCLNSGTVSKADFTYVGSDSYVTPRLGGLIGRADTAITMNACVNVGAIVKNDAFSRGYGPLVGWSKEKGTVSISACYVTSTSDVPDNDTDTYNNILTSYTVVTEHQAKYQAVEEMPLLDWINDWSSNSGIYPTLRLNAAMPMDTLAGAATAVDQTKLAALYAGRTLYQGEMHNHAYTYGNGLEEGLTPNENGEVGLVSDDGAGHKTWSPKTRQGDDGHVTLDTWKSELTDLGIDFAASLDHQQTNHWDHADWDTSLFVYGSEASATITDSIDQTYVSKSGNGGHMHFDMVFPDRTAFETVLNDHYGWFHYNSTTKKYDYEGLYNLTKAQFETLIRDVYAAGGWINLPHPMQNEGTSAYLSEIEDLVFHATDGAGNPIIYGMHTITYNTGVRNALNNYNVWKTLLSRGCRIYATAGSDNHAHLGDTTLTSIYGTSAAASNKGALISQLRAGDFAAGSVGIQMGMYGESSSTVMGGSCDFSDNSRLVVGIGDIHFTQASHSGHTYRVDILTDKGVVYSEKMALDGTQVIAIDVDDNAAFYRVEIYDMGRYNDVWPDGVLIGLGNPIWND